MWICNKFTEDRGVACSFDSQYACGYRKYSAVDIFWVQQQALHIHDGIGPMQGYDGSVLGEQNLSTIYETVKHG